MTTFEIPRTLPVGHLSVSSIGLFLKCPEKWRRRYLLGDYEPVSGSLVLGKAVHAAEGQNFQQKIDTQADLSEADVLDAYADEFDLAMEREEIDWGDDKPAKLKDAGARVLPVYHRVTAPEVRPKRVEREFNLDFEDAGWTVKGYIDVEEEDDGLVDLKVQGRALSQQDADAAFQPSLYLIAKRAEGSPAPEFRFHPLVKVQKPEPRHVQPVVTTRTDAQLDSFVERVYAIAAEIAWRAEYDVWDGAPEGAWWCGEKWCGYWPTCRFGGRK